MIQPLLTYDFYAEMFQFIKVEKSSARKWLKFVLNVSSLIVDGEKKAPIQSELNCIFYDLFTGLAVHYSG